MPVFVWTPTTVGRRALCQEATPFVQARCFDKMTGIPDWKAVNPRLSVVYDIAGDGRTALKFAANRYIIPVGSSVLDRVNPDLPRQRHPDLDAVCGRTDERLRSEQRSASSDQRARSVDGAVQFRQRQSLRGRLQVAVGARILGRDPAAAAVEPGGERRATRGARSWATSACATSPCRSIRISR